MTILIVDDSPDQQLLLKTVLMRAGHKDILLADSAESAYQRLGAVSAASSSAPSAAVDLILMDFLMPGTDGVAAVSHIKRFAHLRDVPIIVVTAKTEAESLHAAFSAGAMDFIHKPVNAVELLARVSSALTLKRETDCRKEREQELRRSNEELQRALSEVKVLKGLVPICASCKKIRNDQGFWQQLEEYIQQNSEAEFSHGLCSPCIKKLYPGVCKE